MAGLIPESNEAEWQTRRNRINPHLEVLGWKIISYDGNRPLCDYQKHAIEEYPTENGPADYALCVDGRILGIVEAKRLSLGPQNVLTQAERYSRGATANPLQFGGFHVPFLYSTNGEVIWFHDVRHTQNLSRRIAEFHTPNALREMMDKDTGPSLRRLLADQNWHKKLRPYQIEANQAIENALIERKQRMLIAMATGTGKTFTMVNQVYRLMKSQAAKRILFLVDRRALAAQAVQAFASHEPEPGLKFDQIYEVYSQRFRREDLDEGERFDPKVLPAEYLMNPQPGHAFVYVSTIQRMAINLFGRNAIFGLGDEAIDEDAAQLDIPIHAFDVIIADECHRGYTSQELSVWRGVLDHFDSVKIGLTATPAAHTTSYFKDIVFRYPFERAVQEGYLVDYDVVAVQSEVRMNGVFILEGNGVGMIDPVSGVEKMDVLEDDRQYDTSQIEQDVTAPASNRRIIQELKRYAEEHEQQYKRFPKTLIFAANDLPHRSHADQLVMICREIFSRGDSFVRKITGRADRPLEEIRRFRNRPEPGIVVSVDMMSTGVDIPDLEFIVFLRPVRSRILFEQMMGRGTRKGDKFPDKTHFTVFDCFAGTLLEYFQQATGITATPPERPYLTIVEIIEDIWQNRDRDYNIRCLVKRLQRIDKEMSAEAREMFARHIPDGDMARYARELPRRLKGNFVETMELLRDEEFQDLLVNYPRRPRDPFVVAYGVEDQVSSQWLIRDGLGNEHRPEDYLALFGRFIRENPDHIEAIAILLDRPRDWNTTALEELREKLRATKERFTVENLQKAHDRCYHKALADIISMVKHAARETEALYNATERVDRALLYVTIGQSFTDEQQQWLDRIRDHLIENLSIDREDFDDLPVFSRHGGWGRADKEFAGKLLDFIRQLNEAIAA